MGRRPLAVANRRIAQSIICCSRPRRLSKGPAQQSFIVRINNANFYRDTYDETGLHRLAVFENVSVRIRAPSPPPSTPRHLPWHWAIVSPSSAARTAFLKMLMGEYVCDPLDARQYPYLSSISKSPHDAIKYVGFDADRGTSVTGTNVRGAYLSARYEARREGTDFSLRDFLFGHTELNTLERDETSSERGRFDQVVELLDLGELLDIPVSYLSNGQTRRARIAKALMSEPELLLIDSPFMGLDPRAADNMSKALGQVAYSLIRLVITSRPEDPIPKWVNERAWIDNHFDILFAGRTYKMKKSRKKIFDKFFPKLSKAAQEQKPTFSRDGLPASSPLPSPGDALVELEGVKVAYGSKVALGDWNQSVDGQSRSGLWWSLRRGQRCGLFGPNGSGKTTLVSLITSDHPQAYSQPLKLFGRPRLPAPGEPGISLFDIQQRMGHASPEVHAFFPKTLTVRQALESAWADAPLAKPRLTASIDRRVDACLRWFDPELNPASVGTSYLGSIERRFYSIPDKMGNTKLTKLAEQKLSDAQTSYSDFASGDADLEWAEKLTFRELSFSGQRLVLFLRAVIAQRDLIVLDEALSGVDEDARDKALLFLSHGEKVSAVIRGNEVRESVLSKLGQVTIEGLSPDQALLVISHSRGDVPGCVREWMCLPEPGQGKEPRTGVLPGPLELNPQCWKEIWGTRKMLSG